MGASLTEEFGGEPVRGVAAMHFAVFHGMT